MYNCVLCGQNDTWVAGFPEWSYCAIYVVSGEPDQVYLHEFKPEQQIDQDHIVVPGRNEPGYLHMHCTPMSDKHDNPGDLFCPGFAFHHYCWGMLVHLQPDILRQPMLLHHLLSTFPKFASELPQLDIGHNYGGNLTTYFATVSGKPAEFAEFRTEYQPNLDRISSVVSLFAKKYSKGKDTAGRIAKGQKQRKPRKRKPKKIMPAKAIPERVIAENDKLSRLPVELRNMILSHLPSPSVVRLMQASSTFYTDGLPDQFWYSRFTDGHEFGHFTQAVWLRKKIQGCWKSVFMAAKQIRKERYVLQRKKVYTLAVYLADMIDARTKMRICQGGMSPQSPDRPKGVPFDIPALIARQSSRVRELYLQSSGEDRTSSIRFVRLRSPVAAVFVSLIRLGNVKYVAGLRILEGNGNSQTLGYVDSSREISMMTFQEPIVGFRFAIDRAGARGVAMLSSSRKISPWVGDHLGLDKTQGVINPGDKITWLEAEFDAVKLVKLWVFFEGRASTTLSFDEHCTHWCTDIPTLDLGWDWGAGVFPTAQRLWFSLERPDQPTPYVTGLTVYYDRRPQSGSPTCTERIIRLEVHFGREISCIGRPAYDILNPAYNLCSRTHFYINGAGGERIIGLRAGYTNGSRSNRIKPYHELFGFTIHTNHDQYNFYAPSTDSAANYSSLSSIEAKGSPAVGLYGIFNNGIIQHVGLAYR